MMRGAVFVVAGALACLSGGPSADVSLGYPSGLALAPDGRIAIADRRVHMIFLMDPATGAFGDRSDRDAGGRLIPPGVRSREHPAH